MRKWVVFVCLAWFSWPVFASLISVSGPNSNLGTAASIILAPANVNDDAAYNTAQQGFNERQGVILANTLAVNGGSIAAGTVVDSHMIFLNTGPGNNTQLAEHFNVLWTFSGAILGVMSNGNGSLEVMSSSILGAVGTLYPTSPFNARGLEGNDPSCRNDCYSFTANQLKLTMRVTEPGDWIRVITASRVPEPGALALMLAAMLGFHGVRKRMGG